MVIFNFFSNPTVFYTFHSHGLLLTWDLAEGKKPESIDDLKLKNGCEVKTAELWRYTYNTSNSSTSLLVSY